MNSNLIIVSSFPLTWFHLGVKEGHLPLKCLLSHLIPLHYLGTYYDFSERYQLAFISSLYVTDC